MGIGRTISFRCKPIFFPISIFRAKIAIFPISDKNTHCFSAQKSFHPDSTRFSIFIRVCESVEDAVFCVQRTRYQKRSTIVFLWNGRNSRHSNSYWIKKIGSAKHVHEKQSTKLEWIPNENKWFEIKNKRTQMHNTEAKEFFFAILSQNLFSLSLSLLFLIIFLTATNPIYWMKSSTPSVWQYRQQCFAFMRISFFVCLLLIDCVPPKKLTADEIFVSVFALIHSVTILTYHPNMHYYYHNTLNRKTTVLLCRCLQQFATLNFTRKTNFQN